MNLSQIKNETLSFPCKRICRGNKGEGDYFWRCAYFSTRGFNAPWLTSDPSWVNQGWKEGSIIDKSAVRLTVEIPDEELDKRLFSWGVIAKTLKLDRRWCQTLDAVAGGGSSKWYIHLGTILPVQIIKIKFRKETETK